MARHYAGVASTFVIDRADAGLRQSIRELGMRVIVDDIVMEDAAGERRMAATLLQELELRDGA